MFAAPEPGTDNATELHGLENHDESTSSFDNNAHTDGSRPAAIADAVANSDDNADGYGSGGGNVVVVVVADVGGDSTVVVVEEDSREEGVAAGGSCAGEHDTATTANAAAATSTRAGNTDATVTPSTVATQGSETTN